MHRDPVWLVCSAEMALEEGARSCLLRFRLKLEEDIKPTYLMDHMISDGVMTVDEEERIRTQVSFWWFLHFLELILWSMKILLDITEALSSFPPLRLYCPCIESPSSYLYLPIQVFVFTLVFTLPFPVDTRHDDNCR